MLKNTCSRVLSVVFILTMVITGLPVHAEIEYVTAADGKLYKGGKPFRSIGVDALMVAEYFIVGTPEEKQRSIDIIHFLAEKEVPFMRTWVGNIYATNNMTNYKANTEQYWAGIDEFYDLCEEVGIDVVPTVIWDSLPHNMPWYEQEDITAWFDEGSQTVTELKAFLKDYITRYKPRECILFWEVCNESNLAVLAGKDYYSFLPEYLKNINNLHNIVTYQKSVSMVANEIKKYDPQRLVCPGNGNVRDE